MELRYTKIIVKNTIDIAALIAGLIAAVATIGGDIMNTFLTASCQPGQFLCPVGMYILFIVLVVGGCLLVIFSVPITLDLIIAFSKWAKKVFQNYLNKPFSVSSKIYRNGNEVFIEVRNKELFLDAIKISVGTHFMYKDAVVQEHIKWVRKFSFGNETASIRRKESELLHFATINNEEKTFYLHLENMDLSFPFFFGGIREFPLHIEGYSSANPQKASKHGIRKDFSVSQYLEKDNIIFEIGWQ